MQVSAGLPTWWTAGLPNTTDPNSLPSLDFTTVYQVHSQDLVPSETQPGTGNHSVALSFPRVSWSSTLESHRFDLPVFSPLHSSMVTVLVSGMGEEAGLFLPLCDHYLLRAAPGLVSIPSFLCQSHCGPHSQCCPCHAFV